MIHRIEKDLPISRETRKGTPVNLISSKRALHLIDNMHPGDSVWVNLYSAGKLKHAAKKADINVTYRRLSENTARVWRLQ